MTCNERQIKVVDRCGGIPRKRAMDEIFCFGHDPDNQAGKLGAYGVGMKRALFKIGNKFYIVSLTRDRGLRSFVDNRRLGERKGLAGAHQVG